MNEETKNKAFSYSTEEDEILLVRSRELAEELQFEQREYRSFLSFEVAGQIFGLSTDDVMLVVTNSEVLEVPRSPEYILGIVHVHGEVMTVCDTSILLHGTPIDRNRNYFMLYLDHLTHPVCFAIEHCPDNIAVDVNDIALPAENDDNPNIDLIAAYAKHGNKYIQILRRDKLLHHRLLTQLLSSPTAE